jgi:HK97 family phage portal protein
MDRFLSYFFKKREGQNPSPVTREAQAATTEKQSSVSGGSFESRIIYARSPQLALTVSAVYRATELRAKTMGVMPVQYQKKDSEKGNFVTDMRGLGKRINYLLQVEPNPIMTASSLWELVTINRLMTGNGFVYIERDEFDFPLHLWLVRMGSYDIVSGRYNISYLGENDYVVKVNVPREDVLHFPNTFRMQNGFWGISTIQYAAETLSLNKTLKNQSLETAAKGGRVKLLIGEEQRGTQGLLSGGLYNKGEMDSYAQELQRKMYNGQDILAIRGLDKVQPISMSSAEMQAVESMGLSYDDVARFWAVPRPLLMLDTNSHYNDYQNATMEFHTRTILPDKTDMEHEIFRKLIGQSGYGTRRIHICEDPLMVMDPERRAKVAQLKMQAGLCTVNEARRDFDMPAVEDGDVPMASANLMTLKALIAKSDASTQLKPGNYTVGEPPKEGEETA